MNSTASARPARVKPSKTPRRIISGTASTAMADQAAMRMTGLLCMARHRAASIAQQSAAGPLDAEIRQAGKGDHEDIRQHHRNGDRRLIVAGPLCAQQTPDYRREQEMAQVDRIGYLAQVMQR